MNTFKRNQIDDAITAMFGARGNHDRASELRRRVTRLLQTDRGVGSPFAFFSEPNLGSGSEAKFSSAEAFAVLTALLLLEQGFPQATAVEILRSVRSQLSEHHRRIMAADPAALFDPEGLQKLAQPGALVVGNTDPTFLAIARHSEAAERPEAPRASVCHGVAQLSDFSKKKGAVTFVELVNAAHEFDKQLRQAKPKFRGRPKQS